MSSGWDKAKQKADEHAQQGGVFVKLANDGDKVVGAFIGEPFAREVVWNGERYETHDPDNADHQDLRASLRVSVNFFVPAENAMKVIEGGTMWFKDVLKVRDKYGLDKWLFEIERHGEAGNPKTTYSILPEEKLDDAMRERIAGCELNDLERLVNGSSDEKSDAGTAKPATKTGPIDPRVAGEIVARLKALPRSDLDGFMKKFGVQRVRDLKASDEAAARAYLDSLTPQNTAGGKQEIDPFV
jgi:hypothetical protein